MKKITILFILVMTSFLSTAHAKGSSDIKKFNFGVQFNALHPMKIFHKYKNLYYYNYRSITQSIITLRPGIFSKYQFNPYLNVELKANILENFIEDIRSNKLNTYISNIEYAANIIYPIKKNINFYTKLGAQLKATINNKQLKDIFVLQKYKKFYPILSVGMEYVLNQYLQCDVHLHLNKKLNQVDFKSLLSILNNINVGLSWKLYPYVKSDSINAHNINRKLFLQNKKNIKDIKNNISCYLNNPKLSSCIYRKLNRFNNRILLTGKDKFFLIITSCTNIKNIKNNMMKLSLKRSLEVSKYFIKHGFIRKNVVIQGFDCISNKTHRLCNILNNQKLLINKVLKKNTC
ncbi:Outer membrane protein A [Buchnera aphidicola (Cinara cuneomaculata)]|uniref:Outer membrane protein A, partial n=1 Tax=Buchnera aphidicola (Cinara cuneomaculata) TaxID=1660040 RepID=A0A451CYH0_9GAMM|nr:outer membrane beta-barrel protein [Buchnera aphidicola]VFP78207.1 Outer membrane protein A [Buchnera aphidicola (Cinara cuneomaculata)]